MRNINEIASWYKKNNQLCNDEVRIKLLSLYTIVAYKIKNLDIEHEELSFNNNSFNMGITDYNVECEFTTEEIRILNTINRLYGYLKISTLLYRISIENPTINGIVNSLKEELQEDLENYKDYDFNEYVIISNGNTFFISNDTVLNDDETKILNEYKSLEQNQFTVFRDKQNGKLVIY